MQQLIEFLANHMVLTSALGVVSTAIIINEMVLSRRAGQRVAPVDVVRMINDQGARIVDLRAAADFKRGHILDSINVPLARLDEKLPELAKHKDKPVVLTCALGSTALTAGIKLRAAGFDKVYPMAGGINGWQNAGLPLTTK